MTIAVKVLEFVGCKSQIFSFRNQIFKTAFVDRREKVVFVSIPNLLLVVVEEKKKKSILIDKL